MRFIRRGWLRFGIRSLLVLMVLVAVPLGWKTNQVRAQRRAVAQINRAGFCHYRSQAYRVPPPGPAWLRRIAGDDIFDTVFSAHFPEGSGEQGLKSLVALPHLAKVSMEMARDQDLREIARVPSVRHVKAFGMFSDPALSGLAALEKLEVLEVIGPNISGDGLRHFERLPKLRVLYVSCDQLTDSDIGWIARREALERVTLASNLLTDATLESFQASENLWELHLQSRNFSPEAIKRLVESLPDCQVKVYGR